MKTQNVMTTSQDARAERLMNAAPDLLDACKQALDLIREFHDEQGVTGPLRHSGGNTDFREEILTLQSAIEKAEGRKL